MKKIKLIYFALALIAQASFSQTMEFENKEVILKVNLKRLDDTTFNVVKTLINKTENVIYIAPFYSTKQDKYRINEYGIPKYHLPLALGTFNIGLTDVEIGARMIKLEAKDTSFGETILYRNNGTHYEKVILGFDYLAPYIYNEEEQKKILQNLIPYDGVFVMNRTFYSKYNTVAYITIPIGCISH